MFEARINQGAMWKKVIDSVKELVTEANFDCSPGGISIQAMDTAHVALVNLMLRHDGFSVYTSERTCVLGVNLANLSKILKTTENNDTITLRHDDDSDLLTVVAEAQDSSKTSEFQLRLMEIEAESMGIPPMDYTTSVSLSSSEFSKICRDMSIFGDTVTIAVTRDGVKFSAGSEMGEGYAMLKAGAGRGADERRPRTELKEDTRRNVVKPEVKPEVKAEPGVVTKSAGGVVKSEPDVEAVETKPAKAEKAVKAEKVEEAVPAPRSSTVIPSGPIGGAGGDQQGVSITLDEPVTLSFALRYFNTFAKGAALSERVQLFLARDSPCMVEFKIDGLGYLRYYLAPKVDANE